MPGRTLDMPLAQKLEKEMKDKDVVFLYVYLGGDNEFTRKKITREKGINEV